jgi:hypothetical protein
MCSGMQMKNEPILREAAIAEGLGRVWGLEYTRGRGRDNARNTIRVTDPQPRGRL